jgi:hypothetical protein
MRTTPITTRFTTQLPQMARAGINTLGRFIQEETSASFDLQHSVFKPNKLVFPALFAAPNLAWAQDQNASCVTRDIPEGLLPAVFIGIGLFIVSELVRDAFKTRN